MGFRALALESLVKDKLWRIPFALLQTTVLRKLLKNREQELLNDKYVLLHDYQSTHGHAYYSGGGGQVRL